MKVTGLQELYQLEIIFESVDNLGVFSWLFFSLSGSSAAIYMPFRDLYGDLIFCA